MLSCGSVVYFYDGKHMHKGLVDRFLHDHYFVCEDHPREPGAIIKWKVAPRFVATTEVEAKGQYVDYQKLCKLKELSLQEARALAQLNPYDLVEVHSPKHGKYKACILKVNRTTADLYTEQGFIRADKAIIHPIPV